VKRPVWLLIVAAIAGCNTSISSDSPPPVASGLPPLALLLFGPTKLTPALSGEPVVGILHTVSKLQCTTTLIAPQRALTAAHCVACNNGPLEDGYFVGVFRRTNGKLTEIESIRVVASHSRASCAKVNGHWAAREPLQDIAVLDLASPIENLQFSLRVSPTTLAHVKDAPVVIHGAGDCSREKKHQQAPVLNPPQEIHLGFRSLIASAFTCGGDSGGPIVAGKKIIGISPGLSADWRRTIVILFDSEIVKWILQTIPPATPTTRPQPPAPPPPTAPIPVPVAPAAQDPADEVPPEPDVDSPPSTPQSDPAAP
jgi:hypothetical protein